MDFNDLSRQLGVLGWSPPLNPQRVRWRASPTHPTVTTSVLLDFMTMGLLPSRLEFMAQFSGRDFSYNTRRSAWPSGDRRTKTPQDSRLEVID